jgi:hypothetical protein
VHEEYICINKLPKLWIKLFYKHVAGLFILNFVCRISELREEAINNLKAIFKSVSSCKLEQEVNEIIFCTDDAIEEKETWRSRLEDAANRVNALAKKRKLHAGDFVDVAHLVNSLKITE